MRMKMKSASLSVGLRSQGGQWSNRWKRESVSSARRLPSGRSELQENSQKKMPGRSWRLSMNSSAFFGNGIADHPRRSSSLLEKER